MKPRGISLQKTLTYDKNAQLHWKSVLQHSANFEMIFISIQKWTSADTSKYLSIHFRVYILVSRDHHLRKNRHVHCIHYCQQQ